jgi:hypothetical protein
MYQQEFDVLVDGAPGPARVVADQRDLSLLELQPWHGQGKQVMTVRHMAYTAMLRQGLVPAGTTWERFNSTLCVDVVGVIEDQGDDDEQGDEQGLDPGQTTTPVISSSSSRSSRGSRSPARPGSKAGTPGTSTP